MTPQASAPSAPAFTDTFGPAGGYLASLTRRESGGNSNAKNPNSSATGLAQFTDGTWRAVSQAHPELGLTPDGRTDPQQAMRAAAAHTADNEAILTRAGLPVTDANRYALHFLGQGGGPRFVAGAMQSPNAPASIFVQPDQVAANRSVFFGRDGSPKTAGQVMADFQRSFGSRASDPVPTLPPRQNAVASALADMPAEGARETAFFVPPGSGGKAGVADAMTAPASAAGTSLSGRRLNVDNALEYLSSPYANPKRAAVVSAMLTQQFKPNEYGFQKLDDGTILRTDPRTGAVVPAYQATAKPDVDVREVNGRVVVYDKRAGSAKDATPENLPSGYRPMSPDERKAGNVPEDVPAFIGPDGKPQFGPAANRVTVNNAVNPIVKGVGDQFVEDRAAAKSAGDDIRSIFQARNELDNGVIAGAGASMKLDIAKLPAIGSMLGLSKEQASNTEVFRAAIGSRVLSLVKGLGSGSGITDADRQFAEKMAGGQIELEPASLRRILDIGEAAARERITRFNDQAGRLGDSMPEMTPYKGLIRVDAPGSYDEWRKTRTRTAPASLAPQATPGAPAPQAAPQAGRRTIGGKSYVRGPNGDWYEE